MSAFFGIVATARVQTRGAKRPVLRRCGLLLLVISLSLPAALTAQMPPSSPEPYRQAIDRIDFLVGEWRGDGWVMTGPGTRTTFSSWEKVERRLGGSVLLVEGQHFELSESKPDSKEDPQDPTLAHHALAIISWSQQEERYRFASALFSRDGGEFPGYVDDNGAFVWEIEVPGRTMRYVISLDDQGRWIENGTMSVDGGKNWFPFFYMSLEKAGTAKVGKASP